MRSIVPRRPRRGCSGRDQRRSMPASPGGVEHGRGDNLVAENVAPSADRLVGCAEDTAALVAAGDDLEGDVGAGVLERQVAELVKLCAAAHKLTHVEHLVMWSRAPSLVEDG